MKILGLAKLTLLDFPGKVACTVFSGYCNLRCPFCHNGGLVYGEGEEITEDEIIRFLKKRLGILEGVCLTGGEPLLNDDVFDFIYRIKELGYPVKLDTNGTFPERLERIFKEGLVDYVAMDIKNSLEKYPVTTGLATIDTKKIEKSAKLIMESGVDYEFRTTVMHPYHENEDFISIGKWLSGASNYYLQGFIDTGNLLSKNTMTPFTKEEMEKARNIASPYFQNVGIRA